MSILHLRSRWRDAELVEQLGADDPHAAAELHARYYRQLVRHASAILGWSAQDAEDVVQDAIIEALRVIGAGERPRQLRPWLYRIVRNRAIDELRLARRQDAALDSQAWQAPTADEPSAVAARRESLREVARDLAGLPDAQRHALLARVVDGASPQETADQLGVSVAAAQMLVARGRDSLRKTRAERNAVGDPDRALRMLAPPGGLLVALGVANAAGWGGLKAPALVMALVVAVAAGGFTVVRRQSAEAGQPAPFGLTGAGYILGHRVTRGQQIPDGTAVVAATVRVPAGARSAGDRTVTLQCPGGMRYAAQLSHQLGAPPAVNYRGPQPGEQPRPDGTAKFRFASTVLQAPARIRIRILCRAPGVGGSLLARPRLPKSGEGHGRVCAKAPYLYRDPEHLFVGTAFRGDRLTLTRTASRSIFAVTEDGRRGWIKTASLCRGWTGSRSR